VTANKIQNAAEFIQPALTTARRHQSDEIAIVIRPIRALWGFTNSGKNVKFPAQRPHAGQ
jgi:hypothetical protein